MNCTNCKQEMEQTDTTYSNMNTDRAKVGQHTGNIYTCEPCGLHVLENLLTDSIEPWSY